MKTNKHKVVVIEQSELLIKGLEQILNNSSLFIIDSVGSELSNYINSDIDIVIINPNILSQNKRIKIRELFPSAKIIAILYNYVDRDSIRQFDDIIEINNNSFKIIKVLESSIKKDNIKDDKMDVDELSDREKEILVAVAKGLMNKEIANLHNISVHTVMSHRKNISRKTRIRTVSGLLVYALLNNLIEENDVLK